MLLYPYNIQLLEPYLLCFYEQGGGDIVVITTPGGKYIAAERLHEDMDADMLAMFTGEPTTINR